MERARFRAWTMPANTWRWRILALCYTLPFFAVLALINQRHIYDSVSSGL
jgi:hypothetical protein